MTYTIGQRVPSKSTPEQRAEMASTMKRIFELAKQAELSIRGYYDETGSTPAELQRFANIVRNEVLDEAIWACKDYAAIPKVDSGVPLAIAHKIELLKS